MPNQSIVSLAILKANWDVRHSDYIENFIPFFSNLIRIKKYEEIDIGILKKDFEKEYGLSIPYHPLKTILIRLKNRGYIYKNDHKYLVQKDKIDSENFDTISVNQQRKLKKLINSLTLYTTKYHNFNFSEKLAEQALLEFFKDNGIGLLFATEEENILPSTDISKSSKYFVAKFIQSAKDSDPETFSFLVDVAVGTALAMTIVYGGDCTGPNSLHTILVS